MFGFLTAPCAGCRRAEHSIYRAHFCGLCNRLRQDYGLPSRFLVNRDATFLSLLGNGLQDTPTKPISTTCCNPLGKPRQVVQEGEAVTYAAAVTVCGLKAKLDDEVEDRGFGPARLALKGVRGMNVGSFERAQRILNERGFPVSEVSEALDQQPEIERAMSRSGTPELEVLSRPTSFAFGKIVSHVSERARGSLEQMGQSLGRLIYTLDAYVDQSLDQRRHQFNPILLQPQLATTLPSLFERDLQTITGVLSDLPLSGHREVLNQILGKPLEKSCFSAIEHPALPKEDAKKKKKEKSSCCEDCLWGCDPFDFFYCCDCSVNSGHSHSNTGCCDCDCTGCDCDCDCCTC